MPAKMSDLTDYIAELSKSIDEQEAQAEADEDLSTNWEFMERLEHDRGTLFGLKWVLEDYNVSEKEG